jgi:predicted small metal-binding protein
MDREIRCECGYVARAGDNNEVVALARIHTRRLHNMDFSTEQLLALVLPSDDDDPPTPITSRQGV